MNSTVPSDQMQTSVTPAASNTSSQASALSPADTSSPADHVTISSAPAFPPGSTPLPDSDPPANHAPSPNQIASPPLDPIPLNSTSGIPPALSYRPPFSFGSDAYLATRNTNNKRPRLCNDDPDHARADEQRVIATGLSMDVVLRIMDERDKYSRQTILDEIRALVAPSQRLSTSGLSLTRLTEILADCMEADHQGGKSYVLQFERVLNSSRLVVNEDVNMEAPPANPTEVARIIWDAIKEQGLDGEHFFEHFSSLRSSLKSTSSCTYSTCHHRSTPCRPCF